MSLIGFARVSTIEQDLTIQLETLASAGCAEVFHGKQSGASNENEQKLAELLNYIRKDDVVLVTKLDRLGRSLKSVLSTIDAIHVLPTMQK
jgi:DNA invertase Pin-like site-specific DNA recombinase